MKRLYSLRILLAVMPFVHSAPASPEALDLARSTVKEWVATEKAISLEEAEWDRQKLLLQDLLEVSAQQIQRLEAELEAGEDRLSASDETRAALLEQQDAVAVETAQVERFLQQLESSLHRLRAQLPEPLQEELAMVYQRLPEASDRITLGLGERMSTVVNLLSRIRQFDEKLTLTESMRQLPGGGESALVRTLYLGLGQAYYLAAKEAGYGTPGADGWVWHSAPELGEAIRETMLLAEGGTMVPKFIDLPVTLTSTEGGAQ